MSLSRLLCPHCPSTFKSQHGRTYHIRAIHVNTNRRNQDHNPSNIDDIHFIDNLTEQTREAAATLGKGSRKEHPYLTGMYALRNQGR
jgi:hypothetical protein